MKSTTAEARAMTDQQLAEAGARLRRDIPRMQSLQVAIKREAQRRRRAFGASHAETLRGEEARNGR